MTEPFSLADDRLVGVEAIAAFRGEPRRRTQYLLDKGVIPAGKEGNIFIASKQVLIAHHHKLTGGNRS
jgi:hypothetical protein